MDFSERNLHIQEMYEKSLLQKQELKNVVDTAVETAIEKNTIEFAKKMLKRGVEKKYIVEDTGLSIKQVEEIAKNIKP